MKKFRIQILTLVALFAVSSFGFAGIISAKAEDTHTEAYNTTVGQFENLDFHMDGASVRTKTYPGIRFEASLNKAQWDEILTKSNAYNKDSDGSCRIDETGLVMVPSGYLKEGDELTVKTSGSILLKLNTADNGSVYKLRGGLSPIDSELYDKKFTARGYIKYTIADNGSETANNFRYAATAVGETDMSSRSLNEVITAALGDEGSGLGDEAKTFVQSIKNRTPITVNNVYNVDDNENKTINLSTLNSSATKFYVSVKGGKYQEIEKPAEGNCTYTFSEYGRHKFKLLEASGISDSFVVDAVSAGHELDVIPVDDMYANCAYAGYAWHATNIKNDTKVDTYNIGGINERMFAYSGDKIEKSMIFGKPLYSKKYYEDLLNRYTDENIKAFVDFSYYFENITRAMSSFATVTNNTGYTGDGCFIPNLDTDKGAFKAKDNWVTESMSLEKFIGMYDDLYKGYVWEKNSKRYSETVAHETYLNDNVDYLLSVYHYSNSNKNFSNIYIRDMKIRTEAPDIGTVLVNRNETTEVNFSGNIEGREYDSLKLVSRYGNKEITILEGNKFTVVNDPENESYMEDGLYYLTGKKDGKETFRLTFDIYDSTKPVEVESFGHSDSKYAVNLYYIGERYVGTVSAVMDPSYIPAETVHLTFDKAEQYGLDFGKMQLTGNECQEVYGDLTTAEIPYLAIDENKFNNTFPMSGTIVWHGADDYACDFANIFVYVLPRHSKAYYELYKNTCDKYAFAYTGGMNNNDAGDNKDGNGQFVKFINGFGGDTGLVIKNGQPWDVNVGVHKSVFTIDDFILHYDDFASGKIWTYELVEPGYKNAIKIAKLFSIMFTTKEASTTE